MGKFIPPKGHETEGLNAVYVDENKTTGEPASVVQAIVFEMLHREFHNTIKLSGIEPKHDDLTQIFQALSNIDMSWSADINYRNKTLVLGSDNALYILQKPSGPDIVLPNKTKVGAKEPIANPDYWKRFFISRDGGIQDLAILLDQLVARLNALEPQVTNSVSTALQPLINMHNNNGIATNTTTGHIKPGSGMMIESGGKLSLNIDNKTLVITNDNTLMADESVIKPKIATSTTTGIVVIGEGLTIDSNTTSPTYGSMKISDHSSESSTYGLSTFQQYGHTKLTDDFEQNSNAKSSVGISPVGLRTLKSRVMGMVGTTTITTSRTYTATETAAYAIVLVGGGGRGGDGGIISRNGSSSNYSGGGGGGGGAGETITTTIQLTKGQQISVIVGGAGGASSFGSYVTARAGGGGGAGPKGSNAALTGGGAAGTSYGTAAGNGGAGAYSGSDIMPNLISGGSGGSGGRSIQGEYGHGGNGGAGGSFIDKSPTSPTSGLNGIQGVCIISLKIGA